MLIGSPSSRGAWIEIYKASYGKNASCWVALLAGGVDRNSPSGQLSERTGWSPSSRGAWIEISKPLRQGTAVIVALLAGGVDRNTLLLSHSRIGGSVALLAGGVDRNTDQ